MGRIIRNTISYGFVTLILAALGFCIYLFLDDLDGPEVTMTPDTGRISPTQEITLKLADAKSGVRSVVVTIHRNNQSLVILDKVFSEPAPVQTTSFPGVDEDPVSGFVPGKIPGEQFRRKFPLWGVQREGEEAVVQAVRLKEGREELLAKLDAGHAGVFRNAVGYGCHAAAAQGGDRRFNADLGRLRVQLHIPLARGPVPLAEAHEGIVPRRDFQFKGTVPQARVLEVERSRLNGGRLAEYFTEADFLRLAIALLHDA